MTANAKNTGIFKMTNTKEHPTGFVAKCRCGSTTGAIDSVRTSREDTAKMLGEWLMDGMTVVPKFGRWEAEVTACKCEVMFREPPPEIYTLKCEVPNYDWEEEEFVDTYDPENDCGRCQGSGQVSTADFESYLGDNYKTCPDCGGRG